jgi:hypothetical protein
MTESTAKLLMLRRRGRPRGVPHSRVSTWLSRDEHDRLIQSAQERGVSVSEAVSDAVRRHLNRNDRIS